MKATFIDKVHEAKAAEALPAYLDKNGRGKGSLGVILEIIQERVSASLGHVFVKEACLI